jgi:hypothetical protein
MHRVQSGTGDDASIEHQIVAKGLTAPRVTPADIERNIASEHYFTAGDAIEYAGQPGRVINVPPNVAPPRALDLLTFCVLVLANGFTVTGESACASPENFDAEIGRKIARQNAVNKIWPLMGYELRSHLQRADAIAAMSPEARAELRADLAAAGALALDAAEDAA